MSEQSVTVFCFWGGNVTSTDEGLSYSREYEESIQVATAITYKHLVTELCNTLGVEEARVKINITYRYPVIVGTVAHYRVFRVKNDNGVKAMMNAIAQLKWMHVDLYLDYEVLSLESPPPTMVRANVQSTPIVNSEGEHASNSHNFQSSRSPLHAEFLECEAVRELAKHEEQTGIAASHVSLTMEAMMSEEDSFLRLDDDVSLTMEAMMSEEDSFLRLDDDNNFDLDGNDDDDLNTTLSANEGFEEGEYSFHQLASQRFTTLTEPSTAASTDIEQILLDAQHRWLNPAEICEILQNHKKFHIAPEPAHLPASGSLFLFDRKVLKYFRNDGHNWRKNKDGKPVKEGHERLKAGSVYELHCYYARGEEDENFQRRCYWLIEEEHSNIVLVHYLEVKGNRANSNRIKEAEEAAVNSEVETFVSSEFNPYNSYHVTSQTTDTTCLNSTCASEYQEVVVFPDHQDKRQTCEGDSLHTSEWPMDPKFHQDSPCHLTTGLQGEVANYGDSLNSAGPCHAHPAEQDKHYTQNNHQVHTYTEGGKALKSGLESNQTVDRKAEQSPLKQPLLDGLLGEGLKEVDSFDRWLSMQLGDVNESHRQSSSGTYWETVETEDGVNDYGISPQARLDTFIVGPSPSQDQLFSIIDFAPNWAYEGSKTMVLITGKFLKSQQDLENCKWSCMFGEVEVPAEVITNGILCCYAPLHKSGRIPFYVSCSNRLACSEVREFEYRVNNIQDADIPHISIGSTNELLLRMRFEKLLSLVSASTPSSIPSTLGENSCPSIKIYSLLKEDSNEWEQMLKVTSEDEFSSEKVKEQLLQQLLKEKLHVWLPQKVAGGGKGPSILDEGGQGVLHFAAALGYDWAIEPTLAAGVSVNFRDVNGWTALHWAAYCGKEQTVGVLIHLGAAPGALTDPTSLHPSGQTPADLASSKGHKGIAGYLAESSLISHLFSLKLKDPTEGGAGEISGVKAVHTVSERIPAPISDVDFPDGLSLKDSLAAVCNATQAAARIHRVFRVESFQRKQLEEYEDGKSGMSDERALSLAAFKTSMSGHCDEAVHAAAIRIQSKFRSWKGRKEFLTIRQQTVKIQAHVRGHQVRKNYRMITWSVGILEKVILRWRRKGSGLRGFKQEALTQGFINHDTSSKEDDYDFLKEGRRQTEARLEKALARVKSMVQYPEARDQYRRLLNVVTEMQETKAVYDKVPDSAEGTAFSVEDLIDHEAFLDDGDDIILPTG